MGMEYLGQGLPSSSSPGGLRLNGEGMWLSRRANRSKPSGGSLYGLQGCQESSSTGLGRCQAHSASPGLWEGPTDPPTRPPILGSPSTGPFVAPRLSAVCLLPPALAIR